MAGRGPVVKVEGAAQLRRTLKAAGDDFSDLKRVHADVSKYVATRAAAAAPRRSGRLAGSLRGSAAKTTATVRAGGAGVPYANPIHWGWPARNIAAQPFLVNTARQTEPSWLDYYRREIDRIIGTVRGI